MSPSYGIVANIGSIASNPNLWFGLTKLGLIGKVIKLSELGSGPCQ